MTVLHLGVIDQPYRHVGPGYRGRGRKRRPVKSVGSKTTFEVAEILERKYHVMELFFEAHADAILEHVVEAMQGATETALMTGTPPSPSLDPTSTGMEHIRVMFNEFLDKEEMAHLGVPGVPTLAAIHGVSHRFAHPYAKGRGRRPSFIDTGLYETSFRAWVD
jgi:hypothetical protein